MPGGIPYIIGNEVAERFSFYGMRAILVTFMTTYMVSSNGELDLMSEPDAKKYFHFFIFAMYGLSVAGALLSDIFLGKYKTILFLSIVYCFGHFTLAIDETRLGLIIGLSLIAIGGGGIKPCVSAHVGDQFGEQNKHLLDKVFSWFYFSINLGSALSFLMIPRILASTESPAIAFGIPGILMLLATIAFWMGRNKFVHIPPGGKAFIKQTFSKEGLKTVGKLCSIFFFVSFFWTLFDQSGSSLVLQSKHMNLQFCGITWLKEEFQAVNPILILLFIPLFSYVVYPIMGLFFKVTPLRKISLGMFLMVTSFIIPAVIEYSIQNGAKPSIGWQVLVQAIMTASEVMVSITCLEFAYTQAPTKMKSLVMACFLVCISFGNLFTGLVNMFIIDDNGNNRLAGANYYWFFCGVMLLAAIGFAIVAYFYKEKTYIQQAQ